jgi:hypothetical protein
MRTLFIKAEESEVSFLTILISMTIDMLQILSYPFNQDAQFPWNSTFSSWLLCNFSQMELYISEVDPMQNLIVYFTDLHRRTQPRQRWLRGVPLQPQPRPERRLAQDLAVCHQSPFTVFFEPILSQFVFIFA